jgi:tetraacyldisaccharide 4'-kinase
LGLLSVLYGLGVSCKKNFYTNPDKLPAKVISIGNLTLGGTGKTPAVISVAQSALKRGCHPIILTRGYRGKARDMSFVSRGDGPLLSPIEAGDEAYLMAELLKGVPVVKGANRHKSGLMALDSLKSNIQNGGSKTIFILDDGFQHWKLYRDVDVLLIDGTNPFGNGKLFPEGILREPFNAIERAHIIVITKADMASENSRAAIIQKIKKYNMKAPIFTASHKLTGRVSLSEENRGLDTLRNKRIYVFSGIANPSYFKSTLKSTGARIVKFRQFRDHHMYKNKDMDEIKSEALGLDIVTTEKDLVKLKDLDIPDNLSALKIEFSIDDEFYDTLFSIIM